jgi:hypothetical protein
LSEESENFLNVAQIRKKVYKLLKYNPSKNNYFELKFD